MVKVLFVCMGNICRSPSAQGMLCHLLERRGLTGLFEVDSVGTIAFHSGSAPDPRSQVAARKRGIELGGLRARQIDTADFERFDYILAMDEDNLDYLQGHAPEGCRHKLHLLMAYADKTVTREVPDPYSGGDRGFEHVLDLLEQACNGLINQLFP